MPRLQSYQKVVQIQPGTWNLKPEDELKTVCSRSREGPEGQEDGLPGGVPGGGEDRDSARGGQGKITRREGVVV